tara:strand:+ start:8048 stop:9292 length:1245 start_codon:yes stop_codon:yes gene_type:complete
MKDKLKLENSKTLYKESFKLVPGGVLGVRRPYNFVIDEYPNFLDSGKGCKIKDVDGNEYTDMLAAYGPIIIGYREEEIDNAVIQQIQNKGFCMTLTQATQNELINKIKKFIPSCEKGIIVKTGSDASTLAIRIARGFTNKNKILRCGYHGWHDWCVEEKGGVPESTYSDIIEFEYNNLSNLEYLLDKNKDKVAAVIMQPIFTPLVKEVQFPEKNYLNEVKKLCEKHSSLLIFDEIRTGFRVNMGGAQKEYNVVPDLTLIGKAMANGYPISAVIGKKDVMNVASHKVFVSSTFFPNSFEQIASIKTIDFLEKNNVLENIKKNGSNFSNNILSIIQKKNINCNFSGAPWMPFISFNNYEETINRKMRTIFYSFLIRAGVFLAPFHHGYIMYRHSEKDLNNVLDVIENAFDNLNKNI